MEGLGEVEGTIPKEPSKEGLGKNSRRTDKCHLSIQWPGAPMVCTIPVPQTVPLFLLPAIYSQPWRSKRSGEKELSARWESEEADNAIPNAGSPA